MNMIFLQLIKKDYFFLVGVDLNPNFLSGKVHTFCHKLYTDVGQSQKLCTASGEAKIFQEGFVGNLVLFKIPHVFCFLLLM